jgi:hypothetical protein
VVALDHVRVRADDTAAATLDALLAVLVHPTDVRLAQHDAVLEPLLHRSARADRKQLAETILIEAQAQEQSVERTLASQTTDDIFRRFGWATGILA